MLQLFDENGKILSPDDGPSRHNVLLNIDEALNETRYYGFMLSSFAELDFGDLDSIRGGKMAY